MVARSTPRDATTVHPTPLPGNCTEEYQVIVLDESAAPSEGGSPAHPITTPAPNDWIDLDLLTTLRERAERHEDDVMMQVLAVSSAMNAFGLETL